jgi:hypothetical protein
LSALLVIFPSPEEPDEPEDPDEPEVPLVDRKSVV